MAKGIVNTPEEIRSGSEEALFTPDEYPTK
jgi:hypothetical protein